jgi:AraC-like DNA-binding protein
LTWERTGISTTLPNGMGTLFKALSSYIELDSISWQPVQSIILRNLIAIREMLKKLYTQSMIEGGVVLPENGSSEEPFIRKVKAMLEREFSNSGFGVEQLAQEMNMSSSQLLRKLKALTSLTTVEFIREYRLQKAAKLLAQKSISVSEVAYQTGFESLSYFTKVFQEKFNTLPSEY